MKLLPLLAVIFGCAAVLQIARCQDATPQCSDLDVDNDGNAMSGRDLAFCQNDANQCCLPAYIDTLMDVARTRLSLGLRLQLRETSLAFNNTITMIGNYFPMFFREAFIGSLPMAPGITFDVLNGQLAPILNNFVTDLRTANASQLIEVISNTIATSAGQLVSGGNATVAACVGDFIRDNINRTDVEDLVKGLTTVQRAVNTLDRIASFLYRYRMTTQFRFPRNCVRRFIELNFCARCTKRTPPLCSNTCGALFRGCLSPYDTVLSRQLDVLWNVSRQVLRITNSTLDSLFMNERSLLNIIQVFLQVSSKCPGVMIPLPSSPGKRQAMRRQNTRARLIPQDRMQELRNLDSRGLMYGSAGPTICTPSDDEVNFCRSGSPPARGPNGYCNATVDCTSSCRCFDGNNERMGNTPEFTMSGIDGQGENPAIDLDESELTTIVSEVGKPVSSFLMQDEFTATVPDGVVVPTDTGERGSGSDHVTVSLLMLLVAVMTAMIF